MNPAMRALIATYLFGVVGLWSLFFSDELSVFVIPHVLFYATLTVNTYFSIRFYSTFTPRSLFQGVVDIVLASAYVALGLSIGQPLLFVLYALLIFTIAPAKYAHMLGRTPFDSTLRKKILIDLTGALMCVCVLMLTLSGAPIQAAWILAIVFFLANVYLLGINPMYRHV